LIVAHNIVHGIRTGVIFILVGVRTAESLIKKFGGIARSDRPTSAGATLASRLPASKSPSPTSSPLCDSSLNEGRSGDAGTTGGYAALMHGSALSCDISAIASFCRLSRLPSRSICL